MGEFEFIDTIRRSFEDIGDAGITGIGDDCAVIPITRAGAITGEGASVGAEERAVAYSDSCPSATADISVGESLVVTADMLVEGVHFLRHATSARELGAKSLAVNLSDVAAMGALPVASFLSIALPPECRAGWAEEFMAGYRELSALHGVKLAGGDTTASKGGVAVNVTLIGRAPNGHLKFRSGAHPGDIVVVNGPLGESAAGLQDILQGRLDTAFAAIHRNPVAQVLEGGWLGGRREVRAMMDLSDGLASDLLHILRASGGTGTNLPDTVHNTGPAPCGLSAEIELYAIPAPVGVELAVTGGEDYKLLLTVAPEDWDSLKADYHTKFGTELFSIGRITECAPPSVLSSSSRATPSSNAISGSSTSAACLSEIVWMENGRPVTKNRRGFEHF